MPETDTPMPAAPAPLLPAAETLIPGYGALRRIIRRQPGRTVSDPDVRRRHATGFAFVKVWAAGAAAVATALAIDALLHPMGKMPEGVFTPGLPAQDLYLLNVWALWAAAAAIPLAGIAAAPIVAWLALPAERAEAIGRRTVWRRLMLIEGATGFWPAVLLAILVTAGGILARPSVSTGSFSLEALLAAFATLWWVDAAIVGSAITLVAGVVYWAVHASTITMALRFARTLGPEDGPPLGLALRTGLLTLGVRAVLLPLVVVLAMGLATLGGALTHAVAPTLKHIAGTGPMPEVAPVDALALTWDHVADGLARRGLDLPRRPLPVPDVVADAPAVTAPVPAAEPCPFCPGPALTAQVFFTPGSAALSEEAGRVISATVAEALADGRTIATVIGHADTAEFAWGSDDELAASRAKTVAARIAYESQYRMRPAVLSAGARALAVATDYEVPMAENRRAEIVIE